MHFKIAYLKLTLFYVLIIMIISVSFSAAIYQISAREVGQGLRRQTGILKNIQPSQNVCEEVNCNPIISELEKIRDEQIDETNGRLQLNLIYFNLLILVLSSLLSYYFAQRALKPIEDMMLAQSRFAADASHELKTPLTAMRSEIEVNLRDQKISLSEAKKLLNSNLEEIGKLETLSNALLKLAKYEDNSHKEFKEISLSEVAVEAYEKIEKIAKSKKISFENDFAEAKVKGDRPSLIELFVILLDNAIKYSPEESKISIMIKKEHQHAEIKIKDQGVGIEPSDLPHIFGRFYRADSSRSKDKTKSYGLGLSIAKRIVELHGGAISADSKPNEGSTFTVNLPLY
ncbi:MAG: HAMP domain-containing sensor histidine kinase [Patescibacteria group bacterium]